MKVLHIISSGGMYGAEAVILNLSRTLRELKEDRQGPHSSELAVFTSEAQPNRELYAAAHRESVTAYPIACSGQLDRSAPGAIRALVHRLQIDVVHAHGYKADLYSWVALRSARLPLISTCHTWYDNDLAVRLYGSLDRGVLRRFDGIVAVSEEVRARLLRAGVPARKIRIISNGIDLRPFARPLSFYRSPAPLRVGLVGRLAPEKGCDLLLRAAAKVLVEFPQIQFCIAGDGPEGGALKRLIAELGIGDSVSLVGHCDDMPAWYRSLDLLVSASRQEGLPIALLEGMAAGLPLVATRVGEVPSLILNGVTGLLIPVEDVSALASAISTLLRDSTLRQSLGAAGRERIASSYSAERMTGEYLGLYQHVVKQNTCKTSSHFA
jgi:glycosyltransferase involved in cell wall biosynthesis